MERNWQGSDERAHHAEPRSQEDRSSRSRQFSDGSSLEALLGRAGAGVRELVSTATRSLVARFGDRGSCILVDPPDPAATDLARPAERRPGGGARVVFSTEVPDLDELVLDLARYPEIDAAMASREVVVIEDVRESACLRPVAGLLPPRLGAVAVVPLVAGERCLGVLMAQSARPRGMSADDVAAARIEGRVAATLLDVQYGNRLGGTAGAGATTRAVHAPRMTPARPLPAPAARRERILVAEDEIDHAAALQGVMTDEGFEVRLAADGREAVREAQRMRPDLVVLDVCMPGADGFVVARELIADARTAAVPILLVSDRGPAHARARPAHRQRRFPAQAVLAARASGPRREV